MQAELAEEREAAKLEKKLRATLEEHLHGLAERNAQLDTLLQMEKQEKQFWTNEAHALVAKLGMARDRAAQAVISRMASVSLEIASYV